ncbi:hypothetical protein CAJAP_01495 [Camponotus japonicus]
MLVYYQPRINNLLCTKYAHRHLHREYNVNEGDELILAFEAQKKINRQWKDELQGKERNWQSQRHEWQNEIDRPQEEIEKQKLLSIILSKSLQIQALLYRQLEVVRLTSKNPVSEIKFSTVTI